MIERNAALAVECPLCYAEPGDACCSEDGDHLVPVHESRITDLKDIVTRALAAYSSTAVRP